MIRWIACKKMLRPIANRNTPLKKAPRTGARCQPNARLLGKSLRSENWMRLSAFRCGKEQGLRTFRATRATVNPTKSFNLGHVSNTTHLGSHSGELHIHSERHRPQGRENVHEIQLPIGISGELPSKDGSQNQQAYLRSRRRRTRLLSR